LCGLLYSKVNYVRYNPWILIDRATGTEDVRDNMGTIKSGSFIIGVVLNGYV